MTKENASESNYPKAFSVSIYGGANTNATNDKRFGALRKKYPAIILANVQSQPAGANVAQAPRFRFGTYETTSLDELERALKLQAFW